MFLQCGQLRVSYNGNTTAFQAVAGGSIPPTRSKLTMEKRIDLSSFLEKIGFTGESAEITESLDMYPHKEKSEDNWSYYTGFGFMRLQEIFGKEQRNVSTVAIVGIGSGVEGTLAVKIFKPTIKNLIISDIDTEIIVVAVQNIKNTVNSEGINIMSLVGSFCEPIEKTSLTPDLVYGNLPNLPATGEENLTHGAEKGTFIPSSLYEGYKPPQKFVNWAMGSQFAYLQSAKRVLPDGGSVVTTLGGRMPLGLVKELFAECGFKLEEVITGFKEQSEALIDFQGYNRLEREFGISFEFYLYEQAISLMKKKGIINPSSHILVEELKKLLEPFKVSAGRALKLYEQNTPVGHTVHIFRGIR